MKNKLLKIKICKLFYQYDLSKTDIGSKLRMSRLRVSKLLKDSIREGIVKISIQDMEGTYLDLEDALEEKFRIYRAVVADTSVDYEITKKNIGKAAAGFLVDTINKGDVVGVAWGTTIFEMVSLLPKRVEMKGVTVVQITGGSNQIPREVNASELSRRIAEVFKAKCYYLHAPAILSSKEAKKVLLSEKDVKNTLENFTKVNVAIVGIGSIKPEPSTMLYRDGYISKEDFTSIFKTCAVGDINSYFYDKKGNRCETALDDRVIGIDLEQIKRIRYVIGIAGGVEKVDAIYGALKGKIINSIVTDHETAEKLLEME